MLSFTWLAELRGLELRGESAAIEDPEVVLIAATAANLFDRTQMPPVVDQLVAPRHRHATLGGFAAIGEQQLVTVPAETGDVARVGRLRSLSTVRCALRGKCESLSDELELRIDADQGLVVIDTQRRPARSASAAPEFARVPIQNILA